MNNIILIGMPSSGKSTLGVMLAKLLGYDFLDTDLLLQKRTGRHLQDILNEDGVLRFKALEEEALLSIDCSRTVIATGGSAVYSEHAMTHLSSIGTVVYLFVPFSVVQERLYNLDSRGVVMDKGESLAHLYTEREALYERHSHLTFDECENGTPRSMAENVTALYSLLQDILGKETP